MHICEVKTSVLPELDDEFATDLGLTSLDELKQKVREGLESQLKRDIEKRYKDQLVKHLVNTHRSEEHTSELQSHWYISYAVFCLKKKKTKKTQKKQKKNKQKQKKKEQKQ